MLNAIKVPGAIKGQTVNDLRKSGRAKLAEQRPTRKKEKRISAGQKL
jgi:hypothetical protein